MFVITGVDDSFQFDNEAVPTEEEKLKKESQKATSRVADSISQLRQAQEKRRKPCAARCSTIMSASLSAWSS
jgi:hypothetical protein